MDYVVVHNDNTETFVNNASTVKQNYGFLEFRQSSYMSNVPDTLIVALRVDTIKAYSPLTIVTPQSPASYYTRSTGQPTVPIVKARRKYTARTKKRK